MRVILFFDGLTCLQFDIQGGHAFCTFRIGFGVEFCFLERKEWTKCKTWLCENQFFFQESMFQQPSWLLWCHALCHGRAWRSPFWKVVARWYPVIPIRAYCIKPCLSIPTSISYHNIPARQTFDFQNERVAISQALSLLHDLHKVFWDRQGANIVAVRSIWLANVTWPLK